MGLARLDLHQDQDVGLLLGIDSLQSVQLLKLSYFYFKLPRWKAEKKKAA